MPPLSFLYLIQERQCDFRLWMGNYICKIYQYSYQNQANFYLAFHSLQSFQYLRVLPLIVLGFLS